MGRFLTEFQHKALSRLGEAPVSELGAAKLRLRQWLLDNEVTVAQFALMTCMDRRTLNALLRGAHRSKAGYLQLHQAFAIEYATKGHVPAYLWLEDPYVEARIRHQNMAHMAAFERDIKRHVLKWGSLTTPDGMLRDKARVLSRLFGVQWSEVKRRAWIDADRKARAERADISHLLAPEDNGPTEDGIYWSERYPEMTDEEWFLKILEDAARAGHYRGQIPAPQGGAVDLPEG